MLANAKESVPVYKLQFFNRKVIFVAAHIVPLYTWDSRHRTFFSHQLITGKAYNFSLYFNTLRLMCKYFMGSSFNKLCALKISPTTTTKCKSKPQKKKKTWKWNEQKMNCVCFINNPSIAFTSHLYGAISIDFVRSVSFSLAGFIQRQFSWLLYRLFEIWLLATVIFFDCCLQTNRTYKQTKKTRKEL